MKFSHRHVYKIPQVPGVYLFRNKKNKILYIGKAKNLKKRVSSYFYQNKNRELKTDILAGQISIIEVIPLSSEFQALLLEASLIKKNKPKYNVILKDDKHYIYIKITEEEFPRILFSRREDEKGALYFGPFPSKKTVQEILRMIRGIFPFCTQKENAKNPCFYSHLGLCNPCPVEIRKKEGKYYRQKRKLYLANIRQIKRLFSGKISKIRIILKKQMTVFSNSKEFEKSAQIRDKLYKLDYLLYSYQQTGVYIENPDLTYKTWKKEQEELVNLLRKYFLRITSVKRIECYDVSNISGKFAVGSMVTFIDGQPAKNYYRRFRIRTVKKQDDSAMLSEILGRRLSHEKWQLPDLLVIDGGKPQLLALKKVILEKRLTIPMIGLSKKYEEIIIPIKSSFCSLKLPKRSLALNLIQRLRDEAHRFAHQYYELLRLKNLTSS